MRRLGNLGGLLVADGWRERRGKHQPRLEQLRPAAGRFESGNALLAEDGRRGTEQLDRLQQVVGGEWQHRVQLEVAALRRLQQTWVPEAARTFGRPVNVLGIIVPTIEAATGLPWTYARETDDRFRDERKSAVEVLGLFCTQATANSRVYEIEIDKRREDLAVFTEPCPGLAGQIEAGVDEDALRTTVRDHVDALRRRIGRWPDKVILGCTHYGIVAHLFAEALPEGTPVIGQPDAVADALDRYFARHPEYALGDQGRLRVLTTGSPGGQSERIERFWGEPLTFEKA